MVSVQASEGYQILEGKETRREIMSSLVIKEVHWSPVGCQEEDNWLTHGKVELLVNALAFRSRT